MIEQPHSQGFLELISAMISSPHGKMDAAVSTGMITMPLWLQYLEAVSQVAALLAPILGCTYVILQIWANKFKGS